MKILLENTDEEHTLTVRQMIDELSKCGISAERKSIYDDLEHLRLFGIDICSRKSKTTEYFVGSREFDLPELKLLVDIVQTSKFITQKKSMELIAKIEKLAGKHYANQLQRQVFVTNRAKTLNEKIYYNVDKIHEAISADSQITFKYFDINVDRKKVYRKNGESYTASPVSLTWDDEKYYLITYNASHCSHTHYRVDKMENIELTGERRALSENPFDLSQYTKLMFGMFHGEETQVSIRFTNDLVGVVYDRFGMDIPIIKCDAAHFICNVKVALSPHFLSWIISFGEKAEIISPDTVIEQLRNLLDRTRRIYKES